MATENSPAFNEYLWVKIPQVSQLKRSFILFSSHKEYCDEENKAFDELNKEQVKRWAKYSEAIRENIDCLLKRKTLIRICPDEVLKVLNDTDTSYNKWRNLNNRKELKNKKSKKRRSQKKKNAKRAEQKG